MERKRSGRSRQRFVLTLLHTGRLLQSEGWEAIRDAVILALSMSTRETDLRGWYQRDKAVGIICREIGPGNLTSILNALQARLCNGLRNYLTLDQMNLIHISFHVFPDDLDLGNGGRPADTALYPDIWQQGAPAKAQQLVKRTIDIVGSLSALVLLSPLLIIVAVAVKLTSRGPILLQQKRLGQYGVPFTFLKFRSMYSQTDAKIHREYVQQFISGKHEESPEGGPGTVYKIINDPRVTTVGRFLRKTSLDELPQFFNVLRGEMSLVGPRPPIPYEIEAYQIWHRRRFLEVKPGITGLWQVEGRSRVKFDEMVRLDLKYARTWSPWLDIKILLRTPATVLRGNGAY